MQFGPGHQVVITRLGQVAAGAVQLLFGVQVADVTTVTIKGKVKRFGRTLGRRSDVKKAYVSLAAGQELDLEAAAAAADKE